MTGSSTNRVKNAQDAIANDKSSLSNPAEIKVTHLDWNVHVDFTRRILDCIATYTIEPASDNVVTDRLDFDTSHLDIVSIADQNRIPLEYVLHPTVPGKGHLGERLSIQKISDAVEKVIVQYRTTEQCTAMQWLEPSATAGKQYPYMFTQCQAIHARSIVPCQDIPGMKMTYTAQVTVPEWSTCLMSAVATTKSAESCTIEVDATGDGDTPHKEKYKRFRFEQKVPISSYLLAMAVGELERREISGRCAVWSEPTVVDAAAYEFGQTEDFVSTAEKLAGVPYQWIRYDLLVLPPSFPYGGMENPCLTFVTPTLLAGDRSLADVVAHEIAHSWTGNLVTNATWEHFWLNEGWTTWFQRKIMAAIHNDPKFLDFDALDGFKALQDTVNGEMPNEYTSLVLPIGDGDPDDMYSSVAYERGFTFLMHLERCVGTDAFMKFFQAYVKEFSFKILTSEEFKDYFFEFFEGYDTISGIDWDEWLYGTGMPPQIPDYDTSLAESSQQLAEIWHAVDQNGRMLPAKDIKSWSSGQITCFLDTLLIKTENTNPLQLSTIRAMDQMYKFSESQNSEVLFRYCRLAIASEDESIIPIVCRFITTQGRMKFVRPLYRALHQSKMGQRNQIARTTFLQHQDFYHPICAKMIANDLKSSSMFNTKTLVKALGGTVVAAGLVGVGLFLIRRKK